MDLYAIRVIERNLPLITRLNDGFSPRIEGGDTYFTFDPTDKFDEPTIITEAEVLSLQRNGRIAQVLGFK